MEGVTIEGKTPDSTFSCTKSIREDLPIVIEEYRRDWDKGSGISIGGRIRVHNPLDRLQSFAEGKDRTGLAVAVGGLGAVATTIKCIENVDKASKALSTIQNSVSREMAITGYGELVNVVMNYVSGPKLTIGSHSMERTAHTTREIGNTVCVGTMECINPISCTLCGDYDIRTGIIRTKEFRTRDRRVVFNGTTKMQESGVSVDLLKAFVGYLTGNAALMCSAVSAYGGGSEHVSYQEMHIPTRLNGDLWDIEADVGHISHTQIIGDTVRAIFKEKLTLETLADVIRSQSSGNSFSMISGDVLSAATSIGIGQIDNEALQTKINEFASIVSRGELTLYAKSLVTRSAIIGITHGDESRERITVEQRFDKRLEEVSYSRDNSFQLNLSDILTVGGAIERAFEEEHPAPEPVERIELEGVAARKETAKPTSKPLQQVSERSHKEKRDKESLAFAAAMIMSMTDSLKSDELSPTQKLILEASIAQLQREAQLQQTREVAGEQVVKNDRMQRSSCGFNPSIPQIWFHSQAEIDRHEREIREGGMAKFDHDMRMIQEADQVAMQRFMAGDGHVFDMMDDGTEITVRNPDINSDFGRMSRLIQSERRLRGVGEWEVHDLIPVVGTAINWMRGEFSSEEAAVRIGIDATLFGGAGYLVKSAARIVNSAAKAARPVALAISLEVPASTGINVGRTAEIAIADLGTITRVTETVAVAESRVAGAFSEISATEQAGVKTLVDQCENAKRIPLPIPSYPSAEKPIAFKHGKFFNENFSVSDKIQLRISGDVMIEGGNLTLHWVHVCALSTRTGYTLNRPNKIGTGPVLSAFEKIKSEARLQGFETMRIIGTMHADPSSALPEKEVDLTFDLTKVSVNPLIRRPIGTYNVDTFRRSDGFRIPTLLWPDRRNAHFAFSEAQVRPIEGFTDVSAHGSSNRMYMFHIDRTIEFDHRVIARWLQNHPNYHGGDIRLLSCSTGADTFGFAQNLANKMGVNVLAPTKDLVIGSKGELVFGPSYLENPNNWKLFKPCSDLGSTWHTVMRKVRDITNIFIK